MRLLLAEDEQSLSKALKAILEGNHYSVDAVYDGVEALAYLDAGNYDALILDIMMPKLDGLSVLQRLRAGGNPVPVLMLTAKAEVEDKVLGLDSDAEVNAVWVHISRLRKKLAELGADVEIAASRNAGYYMRNTR